MVNCRPDTTVFCCIVCVFRRVVGVTTDFEASNVYTLLAFFFYYNKEYEHE